MITISSILLDCDFLSLVFSSIQADVNENDEDDDDDNDDDYDDDDDEDWDTEIFRIVQLLRKKSSIWWLELEKTVQLLCCNVSSSLYMVCLVVFEREN